MIVPATTPPTASSRWNGESAASRWERISMEFSWRVLRAGSPGRPRHDRSRYEPDSPGKCPGESGPQAISADLLHHVDVLPYHPDPLTERHHASRGHIIHTHHQHVTTRRSLL